MWQARKSSSYLHRRLSQMLEVVRQIVTTNERQGGLHIRKETLYYLQDILDHIQDMEQRLQAIQESMVRSQANYFAKISIDVTRASNRMGLVMKQVGWRAADPRAALGGVEGLAWKRARGKWARVILTPSAVPWSAHSSPAPPPWCCLCRSLPVR